MQMLFGFMTSQAIFVAAKLGLAHLLKNGAKSVDELAQATGVQSISHHAGAGKRGHLRRRR